MYKGEKMKEVKNKMTTFFMILIVFFGIHSIGKNTNHKKYQRITFEECCEKYENDTKKCQNKKWVKDKKERYQGKKVAKICPKEDADEEIYLKEAYEDFE